jgi:tRNA threonylcarbamoyladenosine biosynthesis protein TsaB
VKILGLDTATRATTVALWDSEGGHVEARDDPAPGRRPGHATRLMVLIVDVLNRAGMGWDDVDRIAIGVGPGTFTGLRIGIATAKALGRARGIPLVGVSTLQSLAFNGRGEQGAELVLAVLDARRGEVFSAGWRRDAVAGNEAAEIAPRAIAPEPLAELVARTGASALAVGDGAVEFREVLEHSGALVPDDESELHRVTAINHCVLAVSRRASDPQEIRPEYLRLPDAEIARRAPGSQ